MKHPHRQNKEEIYAEDCGNIRHTLSKLPPVRIADEPSMQVTNVVTESHKLDFTSLVEMRKRHQTQRAALGVRTNQDLSVIRSDTSYQQFTRRFHQALREQSGLMCISTGGC